MAGKLARVPVGADPSAPNSARVDNCLLGGKDNYEADQALAARILTVAPDTPRAVWMRRRFMTAAVKLAVEAGVRQFIDLGGGFPVSPSVHETAQAILPAARVVAVDYDPVAFTHNNALLAKLPRVTAMLGDIRQPNTIIDKLQAEHQIDFGEPVAFLMIGVLDYVMDDEHPVEIIAEFRDALASGSYLALTHNTIDTCPDLIEVTTAATAGTSAQPIYRSAEAVRALLNGFVVIPPGVAAVQEWVPGDLPMTRLAIAAGVGRL
jgi:O-methyltransferase involved in polyketide biosynthesis